MNDTDAEPSDDPGEILSTLDVETVDDVDIVHAVGSEVTRIGGLEIAVPAFAAFTDLETDRHTLVPPSWPTSAKRTEIHDTDSTMPKIAWTVFRQNELVTDDETRAALDDPLWALARADTDDIVHTSTVVGDRATCRTEIRSTPNANRGPTLNGVIYFSGPGLASSAMLALGSDGDDQRAFIGDVVAAACGVRPDGI